MEICEVEQPCTIKCINHHWKKCMINNPVNIIITNPHACCYDSKENYCDQISRTRRNQFLNASSHHDIKQKEEQLRLIHSKNKQILGIIPIIHRKIIDLNRKYSQKSLYFRVIDFILALNKKSILLDIHSYPKGHTWGNKVNNSIDLVILYSKYGKSSEYAKNLKKYCSDFKIIVIPGGDNIIIDEASKQKHIALLLEFPDHKNNKKAQILINKILEYFTLNN